MNTFSLFLPPIEHEFAVSRSLATVPYMVAMLGWGAGALLFGKLADDLGPRPVIIGGILLMASGYVGMGWSRNLWQLSLTYGLMVGLAAVQSNKTKVRESFIPSTMPAPRHAGNAFAF